MSSLRLRLSRNRGGAPPSPARFDAAELTDVVVVVPARNEEALIGRCLASIDRAASRIEQAVSVVVAADSCDDATAALAARPDGPTSRSVLEGSWRSAGGARAAGVSAALAALANRPPSSIWLAHTDADCVVPPDWLERQIHHAGTTGAGVAGVVRLEESTPPGLIAAFAHAYHLDGARHRHVHGANLGVRADAYLAAGGWSRRTVIGEDHHLWRRLGQIGAPRVQPTDVVVATSSRPHGRVRGGFAANLRRLERELAMSVPDMDIAGDGYEPLVCN